MNVKSAKKQRMAPLHTPTGLGSQAARDISAALNALLAQDCFLSASSDLRFANGECVALPRPSRMLLPLRFASNCR
jgi:hypothetical protein